MKLGHLRGRSTPDIHAAREADDQVILFAPVHQVQVVVVFERGCVQHLEWNFGDLALLCLRHDHVVLIKAAEWFALNVEVVKIYRFLSDRVEVLLQ